jgi:hypothetical protein
VITGTAGVEWLDTHEPELVALETVDERVDCSHRVILGHIVIERCRKQCALPAIQPSTKRFIRCPASRRAILSRESQQTERFHTPWVKRELGRRAALGAERTFAGTPRSAKCHEQRYFYYLAIRQANSTTVAPSAAAITDVTIPPPSARSTAM